MNCLTIVSAICLVILQSSTASPIDTSSLECKENIADVVFVLDSSASIWEPDFKKQLIFVEKVVSQFNIGPNQTQVGVMTFGEYSWRKFDLNTHKNIRDLRNAIKRIAFRAGRRTNTDVALNFMAEKMFTKQRGRRDGVPHIAVVITDGQSTIPKKTIKNAKLARDSGIEIFAIGVGDKYDRDELENIASKPAEKFVFTVKNYTALESIKSAFAKTTCLVIKTTTSTTTTTTTTTPAPTTTTTTTTAPTTPTTTTTTTTTTVVPTMEQSDGVHLKVCGGKPADIYFVMDSSRSIGRINYEKQKRFVKTLVSAFDISSQKTRVGVVTFSNNYQLNIPLESKNTVPELERAIDNLPYHARGTNTGDAIKFVRSSLFAPDVARREVAHIMIVVTDGLSRFPAETAREASLAHDAGIYMFAIGVGNGIDQRELSDIASDPDQKYMYRVNSFDALNSIRDLLATRTCEVLPRDDIKPTFGPKSEPLDIIFVYDIYSIGAWKSYMINQFIMDVGQLLNLSSGYIRIGRLVDNCPIIKGVGLGGLDSLSSIRYMQFPGVQGLLQQLNTYAFSERNGGRGNAKKVAVLFIDEAEENVMEVVKQLETLSGIKILTIIIGSEEKYMLQNDDCRKYVTVPDYYFLSNLRYPFVNNVCFCS